MSQVLECLGPQRALIMFTLSYSPRNEIDGYPTRKLFDFCNWKNSRSSSQKSESLHHKESWLSLSFETCINLHTNSASIVREARYY